MIRRILLILVFFPCLINAAETSQELNMGYVEMPPLTFTNSEGNPDGFLFNIIKESLNKAELKYKTTSLPANRLKEYLKSGAIDLWVGIKSEDFSADTVVMGSVPVTRLNLHVYYLSDKSPIVKIDDLKNQSIIMMRGYTYGGIFNELLENKSITAFVTQSHESGFQMLKAGRANYLLAYERPSNEYLIKHPICNLHSSILSSFPLYWLFSKRTVNAEQILDKIERATSE